MSLVQWYKASNIVGQTFSDKTEIVKLTSCAVLWASNGSSGVGSRGYCSSILFLKNSNTYKKDSVLMRPTKNILLFPAEKSKIKSILNSRPGQTRTRVAWELTSESLHESFVNFHCLIKREQELHESWQARVYIRVFSTFIDWPNENKSCMRVDKREFTWEFCQLSLLDQTRTRKLVSYCRHLTKLTVL